VIRNDGTRVIQAAAVRGNVLTTPLSTSLTVTVTPGMTAPAESVAVPRISPEFVFCANRLILEEHITIKKTDTHQCFATLITVSQKFVSCSAGLLTLYSRQGSATDGSQTALSSHAVAWPTPHAKAYVNKLVVFPLSFNCQALLFAAFSTSESVNAGLP
jgi:hypothetical protein